MALIRCPECNNEISDTANSCIHCGYKNSKSHKINILVPLIISVFILLIAGLVIKINTSKPPELSESAYTFGVSALNITDKYLDGEYDRDEAMDKLYSVYYRLDNLHAEDDNSYTLFTKMQVLNIHTYILIGTETEVVDSRNELADDLNKIKRKY